MEIVEMDGKPFKLITSNPNNRIMNKKRTIVASVIILPIGERDIDIINATYEEVPYSIWGLFSKDISENIAQELKKDIETLEQQVKGIDWDSFVESLSEETPKTLVELKRMFIEKSKQNLAKYLEDNPLRSSCHGGKEQIYTVTLEKQNMFTSKYLAHTILVQCGSTERMMWNAQGKPCEEWLDYECLQFISEMNAYVTPLVSCQQHIEVEITEASSITELKTISLEIYPRMVNTNETT